MDYYKLLTEQINPATRDIDLCSSEEIVRLINEEDKKVAYAVERALPQIGAAVDLIVERMKRGGRMIYVGAGTSGRLGVLDASECPPTYGVEPSLVVGLMAGGKEALYNAYADVEDDVQSGRRDIENQRVEEQDVVVGISASGTAPYVCAALEEAKRRGAATIALVNTRFGRLTDLADVSVVVEVGAEAIMGSTRMKAGTAEKMVLNMLSTATMVRLGKTYRNLMVDMKVLNVKIRDRAVRVVAAAADTDCGRAAECLRLADGAVKPAVLIAVCDCSAEEAEQALTRAEGSVRRALEYLGRSE